MNLIYDYSLFLIKICTIFFFISCIIFFIFNKTKKDNKTLGYLKTTFLNDHFNLIKNNIILSLMNKNEKKNWIKKQKVLEKQKFKNIITLKKCNETYKQKTTPTLYIIDFKGNISATEVKSLREEISAIILTAKKNDQVLLRLESSGGVVHSYGLAAAQLKRLREKNIFLTIAVDKIAASGGYMMASVANCIIAAPFAIIGSIGVVAQIPNINKLLKKNDIDIELHTAGKFKRTLTLLGENTSEGRKQFCSNLNVTHDLFKQFIHSMRPLLDIDQVSNGEYWWGTIALKKGLIDEISTSDDFIVSRLNDFNILNIKFIKPSTIIDKLVFGLFKQIHNLYLKILYFKIY